jgi:hypothetical protein
MFGTQNQCSDYDGHEKCLCVNTVTTRTTTLINIITRGDFQPFSSSIGTIAFSSGSYSWLLADDCRIDVDVAMSQSSSRSPIFSKRTLWLEIITNPI